ncbi:MAG: DUF4157 domain-containing protein [Acidobacteriia bacterium]|nr:DUF4157 domain-containing protein [Terriglobia bacterium]
MATDSKAHEDAGKQRDAVTRLDPELAGAVERPRVSGLAGALLNLQRSHGNRFVQRLVGEGLIQRKCSCGGAGGASGQCSQCEEEEKLKVQRHAGDQSAAAVAPAHVAEVLRAPGQPLGSEVRHFMEARFGQDLSHVRVHTEGRASESARAVDALAYTVGHNIVFREDQYQPRSGEGKRLLAHELTHVLQQGGAAPRLRRVAALNAAQQQSPPAETAAPGESTTSFQAKLEISQPGDFHEQEADRIADEVMRMPDPAAGRGLDADKSREEGSAVVTDAAPAPFMAVTPVSSSPVQRQTPPQPTCPTTVTFSFGTDIVQVPRCGTQALTASTDGVGVAWSLLADPTPVNAGTTIAADGTITIAATQAAGQIKAKASGPGGCFFERGFRLRSHPTGITSTSIVGGPSGGASDYGAFFEHTFISSDGNVASLENVGVGERFAGIPNPTAATHAITAPTNPFGGTFTLSTATLTPNATNNWFLTASGQLGGTHDSVSIGRAGINVGRFVQSASNPSPPSGLPADMTIVQGLHWFCPQEAAASRWQMPAFVNVAHSRTLRNRGGTVEFVTTVNGVPQVDPYTGPVAVFNVNASPVSTPKSAAAPAARRTVSITADTLPSSLPAGTGLTFSIVGAALGCTVAPDPTNNHAATLTIGTSSGTVVVQVADSTNTNRARVSVTIT